MFAAMRPNHPASKPLLRSRKVRSNYNLDPEHLAANDPSREVLTNFVSAQRDLRFLIAHRVLECWRAKLVPTWLILRQTC